jgi:hypothetical protein
MRPLLAALALLSLAACAAQQKPAVSIAPWAKRVPVSVDERTVAAGVSVKF